MQLRIQATIHIQNLRSLYNEFEKKTKKIARVNYKHFLL